MDGEWKGKLARGPQNNIIITITFPIHVGNGKGINVPSSLLGAKITQKRGERGREEAPDIAGSVFRGVKSSPSHDPTKITRGFYGRNGDSTK